MFTGLSAFPITPITEDQVLHDELAAVVARVADAGVDSIGVLGSTGSYPYLSADERAAAARTAVLAADGTPVIIGVGALTTDAVLRNVDAAQAAGAAGLLVSAMTYQGLTDEELIGFFADVDAASDVPIVVYDNPGTTHVTFTDDLHVRLAGLQHVQSIKLPGTASPAFTDRVATLRGRVADTTTLGVSGDVFAGDALLGGADVWYSVVAGTLPTPALALTRAAQRGDVAATRAAHAALQPIWDVFAVHGSYRVVARLNERLGVTTTASLRRPIRPLDAEARAEVDAALTAVQ